MSERNQPSSADNAKNRLHFLIYNDHAVNQEAPEFLPALHRDLIEVLKRYIPSANDQDVEIKYENICGAQIIEMSIAIDSRSEGDKKAE